MANLINDLPEGNCLIISNGAGAGHIEVTKYLQHELKTHRQGINVLSVDVFKSSFGESIGNRIVEDWNNKAKMQNIAYINNAINYQWIDDWLLSPITFFVFLYILLKNDIDSVITTQPIANISLIRAARLINFVRRIFNSLKPQIQIKLILAELPTQYTLNFFNPLKKLCQSDRAIFHLVTAPPLLLNSETEEEFWLNKTGLSFERGEVSYESFPIRNKFKEFADVKASDISELGIKFSSLEERELMQKCFVEDELVVKEINDAMKISLPINPDDTVTALMLGSQACEKATLEYLTSMIEIAKSVPPAKKQYVFVFCGRHITGQETLFKKVADLVIAAKQNGDYSKNLNIIPLTYQGDQEIAPILARSNVTITKSGGLTSMELLTVTHGKILIHANAENEGELSEVDLMAKGMYVWERGNAEYLQHFRGAQIVTPESLQDKLLA